MWYAIEGYDGADVMPQRHAARADHLARLEALREQGRLMLAGPCPAIDAVDPGPAGFSGSIVIAEFPSLQAARDWAQADPYVAAGVYARVEAPAMTRPSPETAKASLVPAGPPIDPMSTMPTALVFQ